MLRATYKPGSYEQLHWHPIEACYYVISGHAIVRNINGKEFKVSAGSIRSDVARDLQARVLRAAPLAPDRGLLLRDFGACHRAQHQRQGIQGERGLDQIGCCARPTSPGPTSSSTGTRSRPAIT